MKTEPARKTEIEAVCLLNCSLGNAGEIVMLSPQDAETGTKHGMIDVNVAAIKFAKQKGN